MTRVLIVDDEDDIRLLVRLILEGDGCEVMEASSGQEALDRLATTPVDLMILDIRMSGMDGWEVLDELDRRGTAPAMRVLAFSAHVEPKLLEAAIDRGCVGLLVKPFTRDQCLRAVRAALR